MLHQPSNKITPTSIMVGSCRYIDPLSPAACANDITVADVAAGLAAPRFKNQTTMPVSIADHMLRCARIGLALELPLVTLFALLFHDVGEWPSADVPGPVKKHLFYSIDGAAVSFADVEARMRMATIAALAPGHLAHEIIEACDSEAVHEVDRIALKMEALLWMPGAEDWCREPPMFDGMPVQWSALLPCAITHPKALDWATAVQVAADAPESLPDMLRAYR